MARHVPLRALCSVLIGIGIHQNCHAAGGSFSSPGAALLLLFLPLVCSILLLIIIAGDPLLRKKLRNDVGLFLVYVFGTIIIWTGVLQGFLPKSLGVLVLVLLFLAPWPAFFTLYKSYKKAKQSEP